MEVAGKRSDKGPVDHSNEEEARGPQERTQAVPTFKILSRKDKGGPAASNLEAPVLEPSNLQILEQNDEGLGGSPEIVDKPVVSHVLAELLARGKSGAKGQTDYWTSNKTDRTSYHFTHKASSPAKPSVLGMGAAQQASADALRAGDSKRGGVPAGPTGLTGSRQTSCTTTTTATTGKDSDGSDGPDKRATPGSFRSIGIAETLRLQQEKQKRGKQQEKQQEKQEKQEKQRLQLEKELLDFTRQSHDRHRVEQQRMHRYPTDQVPTVPPPQQQQRQQQQQQEPGASTWHWNPNAKAWAPPPMPNEFSYNPAPDYSPQIKPVEPSVPPPSIEPSLDILGTYPSLAAVATFGDSGLFTQEPLGLGLASASHERWGWTGRDEAAFQAFQQQKMAVQGTPLPRDELPQEQIRSSKRTNKINPAPAASSPAPAPAPVPTSTSPKMPEMPDLSTYLDQWKLGRKGLEPEILI